MDNNFVLKLKNEPTLDLTLTQDDEFKLKTAEPVADSASDYKKLRNLPSINGVVLIDNKTAVDLNLVSENTTSGWNNNPMYIPKKGEIVIYTDYEKATDKDGNIITGPAIKIGDGCVPIVDLPFVNQIFKEAVYKALFDHINDKTVHVTQQDRDRWDAKLNYSIDSDNLIFTRL